MELIHTYHCTSERVKMTPLPPSNLSCLLPDPNFLRLSSLFFPSPPFLLHLSPLLHTVSKCCVVKPVLSGAPVLKATMPHLIASLQQPYEVDAIVSSIQMGMLRPREVK